MFGLNQIIVHAYWETLVRLWNMLWHL